MSRASVKKKSFATLTPGSNQQTQQQQQQQQQQEHKSGMTKGWDFLATVLGPML
jgi:hypothetical protein